MFEKNVFVNCPFDDEYMLLLRSTLFTIVALGYNPRIALESSNATQIRLAKIIEMIRESKYSIHDLSRLKSTKQDEYFRMNMPFELGLDFGCKNYSNNDTHNNKKCMLIGESKYEYMLAISDISGIDLKYHEKDVRKLIQNIRSWFVENGDENPKNIKTHPEIESDFWEWNGELYDTLKSRGLDDKEIEETSIKEQLESMKDYFLTKIL